MQQQLQHIAFQAHFKRIGLVRYLNFENLNIILPLKLSRGSVSSTRPPNGYLALSKKSGSTTGLKMPATGASPETDTGVTRSLSGFQTMERKLLLLALLKSSNVFLAAVPSLTSTESLSMIFRSLPKKEEACSRESLRCSIVGSSRVQCPSPRVTIPSQRMRKSSKRFSRLTSSRRV